MPRNRPSFVLYHGSTVLDAGQLGLAADHQIGYSARSVAIGLIRVARLAGT
jgi:hypothetical protein